MEQSTFPEAGHTRIQVRVCSTMLSAPKHCSGWGFPACDKRGKETEAQMNVRLSLSAKIEVETSTCPAGKVVLGICLAGI